MKHQKSIPIILTTLSTLCAASSVMAASDATAYINGNIYTANTQHQFVTSVVVENGVFKYVGNDSKTAASFNKDIRVVDLKGKTVFRGYMTAISIQSGQVKNCYLNAIFLPALTLKKSSLWLLSVWIQCLRVHGSSALVGGPIF